MWARGNGDSVCSVVVVKPFARFVAEILDIGALFMGKSSPPVRWFEVRVDPFYPYGALVLHLHEMVRFDNLYQPVSWRSDVQVHPFPGGGERYSFTLGSKHSISDETFPRASELFLALQSLRALKRKISFLFESLLLLLLRFVLPDLLSLVPHSRQFPVGCCLCSFLTDRPVMSGQAAQALCTPFF